jgi:hypothetical protein
MSTLNGLFLSVLCAIATSRIAPARATIQVIGVATVAFRDCNHWLRRHAMDTRREAVPQQHWQDWLTLVLGIWLFISPWMLNYVTISRMASGVALVIGAMLFIVSLISRFAFHVAEEVIDVILGLCLIASPWAFGYAAISIPTDNAIIVGVLATLASLFGVWDWGHGAAHPA